MNNPRTNKREFQLDEEKMHFFRTFGYVVFKQLFTQDEIRVMEAEFTNEMAEQYAHSPFDGSRRQWTSMKEAHTPFYSSLLEDPRFLEVAKAAYGDDVLGINTDAIRYIGNTRWHRDTYTVHQYGVKFAIYLDPVDADSGALRVIPASHRLPDDEAYTERVRAHAIADVPAKVLASEPGDVVAFDIRTWHSSLGGSVGRRMSTVVYYGNPKNEAELKALQHLAAKMPSSNQRKFDCKRRFLYSKNWVSNTDGHPDRQRWINRLQEIGFFDAPGMVEGS